MAGQIQLRKGRESAIARRHPWIFSGGIKSKRGCVHGQLAEVVDYRGHFLCQGHYHDGSIAVRILSFNEGPIDEGFWKSRLEEALQLRRTLGLVREDNTTYRLIHGEGDRMPGLIVDIYGKAAVIQCHTMGMFLIRETLGRLIDEVYEGHIEDIYVKAPASGGEGMEDGFLKGQAARHEVLENGHRFMVDVETGQKTGFFLDQRDNRNLLSIYAKGKSVTNLFAYSGGFSVYAGKAGATKVVSVDISDKAIALANENMALNGLEGIHTGVASDVMKYLREVEDQSLEVAIVDPPAFAKSRKRSHNAIQAYKRLNALAIQKMKPGGIMMTYSCSQVVTQQMFYDTIIAAAIEAGRPCQIIGHLHQGGDHPINIFHPEGRYLKGLMLVVG